MIYSSNARTAKLLANSHSLHFQLLAAILTNTIGFVCFALVLDSFAFNFMLLRLWQFSAGFTALYWSMAEAKIDECEKSKTSAPTRTYNDDLVTVALVVLGVCLLPYKINVLLTRPLVTVVTAFIIKLESESNQVMFGKTSTARKPTKISDFELQNFELHRRY